MARESESLQRCLQSLDRRSFLAGAAAYVLWPAIAWGDSAAGGVFRGTVRGRIDPSEAVTSAVTRERGATGDALPEATEQALAQSEFVYVSPLRSDAAESRCHGEVWYAWLDGAVVLNTEAKTWKARALGRGLDRARIWVGDYGRAVGVLGGERDAFRAGPHFDARAERSMDSDLLDRLLARFEEKYPKEIGRWRDPMREGFASGERFLIRYLPVP